MIKVLNLEKTCNFCPTQWEGVSEDGESIVIGYRWKNLVVSKGPLPNNVIFSQKVEGRFSEKRMKEELKELLEF